MSELIEWLRIKDKSCMVDGFDFTNIDTIKVFVEQYIEKIPNENIREARFSMININRIRDYFGKLHRECIRYEWYILKANRKALDLKWGKTKVQRALYGGKD